MKKINNTFKKILCIFGIVFILISLISCKKTVDDKKDNTSTDATEEEANSTEEFNDSIVDEDDSLDETIIIPWD